MEKFLEGDVIEGIVTGVEDYGLFVSFGDHSSGLVHISEISDYFVKNVSDYAKVGDTIVAKILSVDHVGHYKLSIKELSSKENKQAIKETKSGFNTLKRKLDEWISETNSEQQNEKNSING